MQWCHAPSASGEIVKSFAQGTGRLGGKTGRTRARKPSSRPRSSTSSASRSDWIPPTTGTNGLSTMSGGPLCPFRVTLQGCIAHDFIQKERSASPPPFLYWPIPRTQALSSSLTSGKPFGLSQSSGAMASTVVSSRKSRSSVGDGPGGGPLPSLKATRAASHSPYSRLHLSHASSCMS